MSETPKTAASFLGFSTDELAGLSSDELTNNGVAIKMLLQSLKKVAHGYAVC